MPIGYYKEKIPDDCPDEYSCIIQKTWGLPETRPPASEITSALEQAKPVLPEKTAYKQSQAETAITDAETLFRERKQTISIISVMDFC
jgi:hypothetical protein